MPSIVDFGARGDGTTLNTAAIQAALDATSAQGGRLTVPAGTFLSGSLRMRSRTTLHLEAGAVLLASPRLEVYPPHAFLHAEWGRTTSFLYALDEEDIRIEGPGTIDLNGDAFILPGAIKTGTLFGPDEVARLTPAQVEETTFSTRPRPVQPMFFHAVRNFALRDVTLRNAPCWTMTLASCNDVSILGIRIRNHVRMPNADGIHVCSSSDVVIGNCDIVCGDDCIALTGITEFTRPCERITVSNCLLRSSSAGVRIGHLASRVRGVKLTGLTIHGSNRGICVFAGEGGCIEDVHASGLRIETRMLAGHWWGKGEPLVVCAAGAGPGAIRRLRFADVTASSEQGVVLVGQDGNVEDVELIDWTLRVAHGANRPLLGSHFDLQPAEPRPVPAGAIPWLYAEDVGRVEVRGLRHGRGDAGVFAAAACLRNSPKVHLQDVRELT